MLRVELMLGIVRLVRILSEAQRLLQTVESSHITENTEVSGENG